MEQTAYAYMKNVKINRKLVPATMSNAGDDHTYLVFEKYTLKKEKNNYYFFFSNYTK